MDTVPKLKAKELVEAARQAARFAYAPYSKFKVGAALLTKMGKIVTACNVENASYGLTLCAERAAIAKAVSEGFLQFHAIAVVSTSQSPIFPCGACRQMLVEFGKDILVLSCTLEGTILENKISDLLPNAFANPKI